MRIIEPVEYSFEVEKSRFIGYLYRCFSVEEAKAYLEEIRGKHPEATHVVHAYRIGQTIAHSSDDKEPAGTAGVPIREVLEKKDITDCIALVVRYFGGVKLGAGGLARAYTKAISGALEKATLTESMLVGEYQLKTDYSSLGKVEYFLRNQYDLLDIQYGEEPVFLFQTPTDPTIPIQELTKGKYLPEKIRELEKEVPIP